jgi:transposase-like protein
VEHRQGRYINKHGEVSHQPSRRRERQMQRFTSQPVTPRASCTLTVASMTTSSSVAIT